MAEGQATPQPALILLDSNLPILNGWEVARRLRAIPETRAIPVIVLTGYLPPQMQEQLGAIGVDGCELKPIDFPQLLAKVRRLAHHGFADGLNERQAGAD